MAWIAAWEARRTELNKRAKNEPCPHCEAQPGEPCKTASGNPITDMHRAREKGVSQEGLPEVPTRERF